MKIYRDIWRWLLHIGPVKAALVLNAIFAVVAGVALALVKWVTGR